jgi:23S rRNA pseudouridine1911/1915/1917 synthase
VDIPPIIQEDDELVAFDKPSGVAVGDDGLMKRIHEKFGRNLVNVHRLEEEASGVLLCAKNKAALDYLSGQFQSKSVLRKYLALVAVRAEAGALPPVFAAAMPVGPDVSSPGKIRVYGRRENGKDSRTEFAVIEPFRGYALVECRPLTSQMHQIRFHLAGSAAPVVGEELYAVPSAQLLLSDLKRHYKGRAEEKPLIGRVALHASELTFRHPATRDLVTVTALLPHDFEVALKYLRKFALQARV